jgi:hypothetical protein
MNLLDYSVPMNTIIHIYNFEGGRNKNSVEYSTKKNKKSPQKIFKKKEIKTAKTKVNF